MILLVVERFLFCLKYKLFSRLNSGPVAEGWTDIKQCLQKQRNGGTPWQAENPFDLINIKIDQIIYIQAMYVHEYYMTLYTDITHRYICTESTTYQNTNSYLFMNKSKDFISAKERKLPQKLHQRNFLQRLPYSQLSNMILVLVKF